MGRGAVFTFLGWLDKAGDVLWFRSEEHVYLKCRRFQVNMFLGRIGSLGLIVRSEGLGFKV